MNGRKEAVKMDSYVYPAVFKKDDSDGSYTVFFPDIPACMTQGYSLPEAINMAEDVLRVMIELALEKKEELPAASSPKSIHVDGDEFVSMICVQTRDPRAVKKMVSIPKWMDDRASKEGLSLSRVLQNSLERQFNAEA